MAKRRADQLSGGQKQRVAIDRMLIQKAELVLADEPIASLDPKAGREVMDLLCEVVRERDLTVICVLHQMDVAMDYGERIIGLKNGELVLDNDVKNISTERLQSLYEDGSQKDTENNNTTYNFVERPVVSHV
ncbi:ATP-binding cassette domain-containing protein [Natranaerobius trueperi]|uniref:ATP-binding cassette domain-containing protein n=1 Tax=Natranaerobius trueperi TaxID=759412 RepID=UPI001F0B2BD0